MKEIKRRVLVPFNTGTRVQKNKKAYIKKTERKNNKIKEWWS